MKEEEMITELAFNEWWDKTQVDDLCDIHPMEASRATWFHQQARIEELEAQLASLRDKYNDLIMQVEQKIPGEGRHETARRYIIERESVRNGPEANKAQEGE